MSSFDRISGNYYLDALSGSCGLGDIHFTANTGFGTVYINGNLVVSSNYTQISSMQNIVVDRFIKLGTSVNLSTVNLNAGIKIDRGSKPEVSILWNDTILSWQITNDGINFANIYGKDPVLGYIEEDTNPKLGNHLDTRCFEIRSPGLCNIILNPGYNGTATQGAVQIKKVNTGSAPNNVPGSVVLYARDEGNGGTALYTTDINGNHEELITKRKAVVFSLVL
jgi:hypothetical protein